MTPEEHIARAEELTRRLDQRVEGGPSSEAVALAAAAQTHYQAALAFKTIEAQCRLIASVDADQARADRAERAHQVYANLGQVEQPRT